MRRALIVVIVLIAAFGVTTLVALEGGGVAVLTTTTPDGSARKTRVWFAESDGALWVEAATESRPFFVDLVARPELVVELRRSPLAPTETLTGIAQPVAEPGGHERIRSLLAAGYGWADAWIGLLQDTSQSRAVRIETRPLR